MLGNLVDALLTVGMVMVGPAAVLVVFVLVRLLTRPHDGRGEGVHGDPGVVRQPPAVVYVVVSILAGAAGAFISLVGYFVGIALAMTAVVLLFHQAGPHRWSALGGYLLGMGLCGAGLLSQALTNHDPAVTYSSSTIPTFWFAVSLALCGAATLVAATTSQSRRERRGPA